MNTSDLVGFTFVVGFLGLMLFFLIIGRKRTIHYLRDIPAFNKLKRGIGLAVEAGQRLHLSLGRGGVFGVQGGSGLLGLSMLQRIARVASVSDHPPVVTSGEGGLAVLSQDTLQNVYWSIGAENLYEPLSAQLTGLTPFSYVAGALPIMYDRQVAVNLFVGHFGSEVALLMDAGERNSALTMAGSDNIPAQAVLYATAQQPLIGEELFAGGAYIQAGAMHLASVRTQDVMRWILVGVIITGAILKLTGVM